MIFHSPFRRIVIFLSLVYVGSCTTLPELPWKHYLPEKTIALFLPGATGPLNSVLKDEYFTLIDDLTPSAISLPTVMNTESSTSFVLQAVAAYPDRNDAWNLIYITQSSAGNLSALHAFYAQPFHENSYHFKGVEIFKFVKDERMLFGVQLGTWIFFSESSFALEECIRTGLGDIPALKNTDAAQQGTLFLNPEQVYRFAQQEVLVRNRPYLDQALDHLLPSSLSFQQNEASEDIDWEWSGSFPVEKTPEMRSFLSKSMTQPPAELTLDRFVSMDAAGFFLMQAEGDISPSNKTPLSSLDSLLSLSSADRTRLQRQLGSEMAFVMFPPSGFMNVGENLFIRKLTDTKSWYDLLKEWESDGHIRSAEGSYYVQSAELAHYLGFGMCSYESFYLSTTSDVLVISPRLGLSNRVRSDRSRRRVIFYDSSYRKVKESFPETVSAFLFAKSKPLMSYLSSYLQPSSTVDALLSKFELGATAFSYETSTSSLTVEGRSYITQTSNQPFEELWIAPLDGGTLTGPPVLADLGGSSRDEVLVSTSLGNVYGIATDGTVYFQADTRQDIPVGSPVVYDWYGNGQETILLGAGNKVYAWNKNGTLLPKFPFELPQKISAPIVVADLTRNGIPELIVSTSERNLYVLNGRGTALDGWPVSTNAEIIHAPVVHLFQGETIVSAVADNGVYSFGKDGRLVDGFPIFLSSSLSSTPTTANSGMFVGSSDGHLYHIGKNRVFSDSLNILSSSSYDSVGVNLRVSGLFASDTPISSKPFRATLPVRIDSATTQRIPLHIIQSSSGNVTGFDDEGFLKLVVTMGQPSSLTTSPFLADVNQDGKIELMALANFGRLYAWTLPNLTRYYAIPTLSMTYPISTDLNGDGRMDIIAHTRGGLRCWSINPSSEQ